jgi:hypothetical protein
MFYNSIKLNTWGPGSPDYVAIHRTYPGTVKNVPDYDPPSRGWFASAPEGGIFMTGPYVETFTGTVGVGSPCIVHEFISRWLTGTFVINLSSRKTFYSPLLGKAWHTAVGAAVITLDGECSQSKK